MLTSLLPLLFVLIGWWSQQTPVSSSRESDLVISTDVELVILDVSVKDVKGGYVSSLAADNFRVFEDNKPQQIKYFSHTEIPVTIGLVIDNSGSMRSKRSEVISAALALVGASNPRDEIFVVNFNDKVSSGLPSNVLFSDDVQTLRKALWFGNSEGRTKLYDALDYSLLYLDKGRMDKKTLVVVSDGGDNASILNRKAVMRSVEESRATIYTIDIFDESDPDNNSDVLKQLAQVSGGEYFRLRETPEILAVCKKIATDIRSRYTIAYVPSHLDSARSMHLVKVKASGPSGEKLMVSDPLSVHDAGAPPACCPRSKRDQPMSVHLLLEDFYVRPKRRLRFARALLLLIGLGALSYGGWVYVDAYIHERAEAEAFDRARESRTQPAARQQGLQPSPAVPFRAKLVIARLHLMTIIEEGVGEDTLRHAAGHIPSTAWPGQPGNVGVAAHRDTLFRKLKGIRKRDHIVLSTLTKDYDYEVTGTAIVRPSDVSVLAPASGEKMLTLVTCYPFYFIGAAPKRFIVHARQLDEKPASIHRSSASGRSGA